MPTSLVKQLNLVTWPIWIAEDQSGTDDIECSVDVHRIGIFEGEDVDFVFFTEMSLQPLDASIVGYLSGNEFVYQLFGMLNLFCICILKPTYNLSIESLQLR